MNRHRRIAVIVISLLGMAGVAIWLLPLPALLSGWKAGKPVAATADATRSDHTIAPAAMMAATYTSASRTPAAAPITPEEFAKAWQARALKAIRNKNARFLGEEVADLLALPPDQAWAELTRRAHSGDLSAAAAAMKLGSECARLKDAISSKISSTSYSDAYAKGLSPELAQRLHAMASLEQEQLLARAHACSDVGGVADFALLAIDRFMRGDNPDVQLYEAQELTDDATAIATIRQLAQSHPNDSATQALAERLFLSANAEWQEEGRATLETLAAKGDMEALDLLATCLRKHCLAFGSDGAAAAAWQRYGAEMGSWFPLQWQMEDLSATHEAAQAWAWAQYRVILAHDGCFEFDGPTLIWLGEALQDASRLQRDLSATQQIEGEVFLRQLLAQWSVQAHAAQGCG